MKSRKENEFQDRDDEATASQEQEPLKIARRRRGSLIAMERKNEILSILSQKRKTTYAELAQEFNVSTKTIQTDIEELLLIHPIETRRGRQGGIWLPEGYYPDTLKMTKEQTALCRKLMEQLSGRELEVMESILTQFGRKIL